LLARDWREARRLSEHFAARFAAEPVPLVEFLVGRGRLLADLGEKGSSAPMVKALHRCRKLGQGLAPVLEAPRQGYWRRSKLVNILPGDATMRARSCLEHCVARRGQT
jgi:hypothetical protein